MRCVEEHDKSSIFGLQIHQVTLSDAINRLHGWIQNAERSCRYVVTPNLDHAVQIQNNPSLREAYASASLVVADGWPLVLASRCFREPLPERVPGSDLVPGLLRHLNESKVGGTVFLLGAAPGVAELAAQRICREWSRIRIAGTYSPPFGFENDPEESCRIIDLINPCSPDVLVVGLGAPKQELWLKRFHSQLSVGVAIAAGGTIDFLAGRQIRAPVWVQKLGMEWTHRLITNPKRLAGRYVQNAWSLPGLMVREVSLRRMRASSD
jgi:N-acetylglucosaminyldiphosphoundecaprenol N-acetyl-beta-D-mannosaminyltransferase